MQRNFTRLSNCSEPRVALRRRAAQHAQLALARRAIVRREGDRISAINRRCLSAALVQRNHTTRVSHIYELVVRSPADPELALRADDPRAAYGVPAPAEAKPAS